MSEVKKYTFDVICESQDFNHDQDFVQVEDYSQLLFKLEEKERECERLKHILFQIDFAIRPHRYEPLAENVKWDIYCLASDNGCESKALSASGGKVNGKD